MIFKSLLESAGKIGLFTLLITTSLVSAKQLHIEELDLKLDLPNGFVSANNFSGFINPNTFASIRYEEILQSFVQAKNDTLTHLKNIKEHQPIKVSNKQGILIRHENTIEDNQLEYWTLIFGDKISSISVSASYPKTSADKNADKMLKALKSVSWLRLPSEQIFTGLPFVANQTENLKISQRHKNSIVMTHTTSNDEKKSLTPSIVISVGSSEQSLDAIATLSKQLIKTKRFEQDLEIITQKAIEHRNIQGFELTATATDKITGQKAKILQTIIYQQHRFLLIQGMAEIDQAAYYWPQFREVIESVKFK